MIQVHIPTIYIAFNLSDVKAETDKSEKPASDLNEIPLPQ
jgi:hypothetical protein